MKTFADWLRHYNNLDVAPALESLQKMRAFYNEKGLDILKDAVNIPGISLHSLLRRSVEWGAKLWSPGEEEYAMLKGVVVGGPSLVVTRYHEAGVTTIRGHREASPKPCKQILATTSTPCICQPYVRTCLVERVSSWPSKTTGRRSKLSAGPSTTNRGKSSLGS